VAGNRVILLAAVISFYQEDFFISLKTHVISLGFGCHIWEKPLDNITSTTVDGDSINKYRS